MFAIGLITAIGGWMVRSLWAGITKATQDNTDAIRTLSSNVQSLSNTVANLQGQLQRRR